VGFIPHINVGAFSRVLGKKPPGIRGWKKSPPGKGGKMREGKYLNVAEKK